VAVAVGVERRVEQVEQVEQVEVATVLIRQPQVLLAQPILAAAAVAGVMVLVMVMAAQVALV
jgi:hypothetical protein